MNERKVTEVIPSEADCKNGQHVRLRRYGYRKAGGIINLAECHLPKVWKCEDCGTIIQYVISVEVSHGQFEDTLSELKQIHDILNKE